MRERMRGEGGAEREREEVEKERGKGIPRSHGDDLVCSQTELTLGT